MQVLDQIGIENTRIMDVLDIIVYFFNNEFDAIATLCVLQKEDLVHQCDKIYPNLLSLFLIGNLLYEEYENHIGIHQLFDYIKFHQLFKFCQTNTYLIYWRQFRERTSLTKLQCIFDQIASKLQNCKKTCQLYNFNNYFMLDFKPHRDRLAFTWFEKVFFHFYKIPITKNENHQFSTLTKELDAMKYQNGENPYDLFDIYSLAYFFQQAHKKLDNIAVLHITQLLPDEKNWKQNAVLRHLRSKIKINEILLEHLRNLLPRFYQSQKMFDFIFQLNQETNADDFFLDVFDCHGKHQNKADIMYFLKQKDLEQETTSKKWLGVFIVACLFSRDRPWQGDLLELLSFSSTAKQWELFCDLNDLKKYSDDYNWYLKKCWLLLPYPQNLEFHLIEMFVTKQFFTTQDHETIFSLLYNYPDQYFDAMLFYIHPFIPTELFVLFDLVMFYYTCKQIGLDILATWYVLEQQFKKKTTSVADLRILIDFCLPSNCKKTYPELARCFFQRDELKKMFQSKQDTFSNALESANNDSNLVELICQQKTIQKCLRDNQNKIDLLQQQKSNEMQAANLKKDQHITKIVLSLTNWFDKHSDLNKNDYWIRFGYRMQIKQADIRAQEDHEKTQNELAMIYRKKNAEVIVQKQIKKTFKKTKNEFVKTAKEAAENAKNCAIHAAKSAMHAKKIFCTMICRDLDLVVEKAKNASKTAFYYEKKTLQHVADIETLLVQVKQKQIQNRLQSALDRSHKAKLEANCYAVHALKCAQDANLWLETISMHYKKNVEYNEMFHHFYFEKRVFRTCFWLLVSCNSEMVQKNEAMQKTAKVDKKFLNTYQQLMLALEFLEHPRPYMRLQNSDFGKNTICDLFHGPLYLVNQYLDSKCAKFEFLVLNKGCLLNELFNMLNLILKISKSSFFKEFAKLFKKFFPFKNILVFNDICKLLQESVFRYSKLIHKFRKISNNEFDIMITLYSIKSDEFTNKDFVKNRYHNWATKNAIPAFISCETNFVKLMTVCWLNAEVHSTRTLFQVLDGVSGEIVEVSSKIVEVLPPITTKKIKTEEDESNVQKCAKILSFFRLDTQLVVCLSRIFNCMFDHCNITAFFFVQLTFLTELNQKDYNKIIVEQLIRSDCNVFMNCKLLSNDEKFGNYKIIADYCNFTSVDLNDDVYQRTKEFIDLLRSTLNLLHNEIQGMIEQRNRCINSRKIFIFMCYLTKAVDRIDMMLSSIQNVRLEDQESVLKMWHCNKFKVSAEISLLWAKEFKIPIGLQSLDDFVISSLTSDWIDNKMHGNLLDVLNDAAVNDIDV